MPKRGRGPRAGAGRGAQQWWVYLAGSAVALGLVGAIILAGVATRAGQDGGNVGAPIVLATPRPESVPRDGMTYGQPSAPVTVAEYLDFQCPVCRRASVGLLPIIEEEFIVTGKARLEAHPIAILGDESGLAAQAAQCAGEQGKFWEFHDVLFANQAGENKGAFTKDRLKQMAGALQLDTAAFGSCLDSGRYAGAVAEATRAAKEAGVQGTPTFFVNGVRADNSVEGLRKAIEAALAGG